MASIDISANAVQQLHIFQQLVGQLCSRSRGNTMRLAGVGTVYQVRSMRLLAYDGDSRTLLVTGFISLIFICRHKVLYSKNHPLAIAMQLGQIKVERSIEPSEISGPHQVQGEYIRASVTPNHAATGSSMRARKKALCTPYKIAKPPYSDILGCNLVEQEKQLFKDQRIN
jgi:hypothetical protein